MTGQTKAILLTLLCVLMWSFIPVVARCGQSELDSFQFLFWSNLLSTMVVMLSGLIAGQLRGLLQYRPGQLAHFGGLGFLGCFFYYVCLYRGYAIGEGLQVLVFQYTWPILIVLLSVFLLREKLSVRRSASVILGFAGVLVVLSKGQIAAIPLEDIRVGGIVLAGTLSFALFSVLSKKVAVPSFHAVFYFFAFATVFSLVAMLTLSEPKLPPLASLPTVLINGALINGLSYVMWILALSKAEASKLAPLVFLSPVLSALWIVMFFGEPFVAAYAVGLALAVGGGLVSI